MLGLKLDEGNIIKAINSQAVAPEHYTAGITNWNMDELKNIDRKTRT